MINNISTENIRCNYPQRNYKIKQSSYNLAFGGNISIPASRVNRFMEFLLNKLGIVKRTINNKMKNRGNNDKIVSFCQKIINVDENSPEYIKYLYNYARKFGKKREVEINLESRRILDIVNSDESCIFVMNHDNRKKDPAMLGILYSLLYGAYIKAGKASTCPRPKVIVNEDILLSMGYMQRAILGKFGTIGVNASLFGTDKGNNARQMHSLLQGFISDRNHIFIFPEGKMAMFEDLDLKYKFQTGVAGIVNRASKSKKSVKVVPIGFAYNEESEKFLGSIYLGAPVYFKPDGQNLLVNRGNTGSGFASQNYVDFFSQSSNRVDDFKTITSQGQPVTGRDLNDYVAGILCENLKICREEAKKQLPTNSLGEKVIKI
ncbi:MAG: 1-acyl-sn-glycerol-3-phosphate acyltransferase [Candidatus Gastranaerophilaceae bacterium]